jgi:hypothetical protein
VICVREVGGASAMPASAKRRMISKLTRSLKSENAQLSGGEYQ